jgi:hypothetical protein
VKEQRVGLPAIGGRKALLGVNDVRRHLPQQSLSSIRAARRGYTVRHVF